MAIGRDEMRGVTGLLLVVNLVLYLVIIGLASWCLYQEIDNGLFIPNRHFGGNTATRFVLTYGLLGGVIGVCSVIAGFIHNRAWSRDSMGIATSTALLSFAVTAIAFGLVCKEIALGGHRGSILKTLESFVIVSTFFQILYLLLLHAGMYHGRYGPTYS